MVKPQKTDAPERKMPGRKVWRPAQEIETERRPLPMNPEVQKLKHSFWMSILWIVLLLVAVTGSTYAWLSLIHI